MFIDHLQHIAWLFYIRSLSKETLTWKILSRGSQKVTNNLGLVKFFKGSQLTPPSFVGVEVQLMAQGTTSASYGKLPQ